MPKNKDMDWKCVVQSGDAHLLHLLKSTVRIPPRDYQLPKKSQQEDGLVEIASLLSR